MKKKISIEYQEFKATNQLPDSDTKLVQEAIKACSQSYSPFSHFRVGAALQLQNGEIITAANQESEAFPSGLCAERSAIYYVLSKYPKEPIVSIAIAAKRAGKLLESPTRPCGACLQVMLDAQKRGGQPIKVILAGSKKIEVIDSINDLLPFSFDNLNG